MGHKCIGAGDWRLACDGLLPRYGHQYYLVSALEFPDSLPASCVFQTHLRHLRNPQRFYVVCGVVIANARMGGVDR